MWRAAGVESCRCGGLQVWRAVDVQGELQVWRVAGVRGAARVQVTDSVWSQHSTVFQVATVSGLSWPRRAGHAPGVRPMPGLR